MIYPRGYQVRWRGYGADSQGLNSEFSGHTFPDLAALGRNQLPHRAGRQRKIDRSRCGRPVPCARRNIQFSDADFFNLDVKQAIRICLTLGELGDALKNFETYGLLRRWRLNCLASPRPSRQAGLYPDTFTSPRGAGANADSNPSYRRTREHPPSLT
jgi:hypothetical protein